MSQTTSATRFQSVFSGAYIKLQDALRHLFRTRNLIIVCEHTTKHYRFTGSTQLTALVVASVFLGWTAFSTGGFMTTRATLQHLLRGNMQAAVAAPASEPAQWNHQEVMQMAGIGDDERIAMLEQRLAKMSEDREVLIEKFATVAEVKSEELEHVIATTGLDTLKLTKKAAKKSPKEKAAVRNDKPTSKNQGGPYVPFDVSTDETNVLTGQLDRLANLQNVVEKLPLSRPIGKAQLMSPFGTRVDPITGRSATHTGLDFSGPSGSNVLASNDGTVVFAARHSEYGNMIDISHGLGITTRYAHLSKMTVKNGQKVRKGEVIGVQGSTGRATGAHLHYEVRYNDIPLNPMKFMRAGQLAL